jgi:hypothetical protein
MAMELDFETALEALDGLAEAMGSDAEGRARILKFNDQQLALLFKAYAQVHGMFRDPEVVQRFLKNPVEIPGFGKCSPLSLLESGDIQAMTTVADRIYCIFEKC